MYNASMPCRCTGKKECHRTNAAPIGYTRITTGRYGLKKIDIQAKFLEAKMTPNSTN